jgi:nucleoside-diphosphate-sugar epimerase
VRALVTGATGFIGLALCRQLMADGVFVRAATRHRGGKPVLANESVAIDAVDGQTDWTAALGGIDTIFHLAGIAHIVAPRKQDPALYERVNADGTEALARDAVRAGVRRFVLVSSLKVNGEQSPPEGFRESDPVQPQGVYAVSKLHAEQRLADVGRAARLHYAVVRPPLVYGPGVRANFLALIQAVDRGRPLPLASVRNRRSLIYVENLCSALRCVANHAGAAGQVFFASDGEPVSTPDLIRGIATALGRSPRLFPAPVALLHAAGTLIGRGEAVRRLTASLTVDDRKIRGALNWLPPHDMHAGLAATIAWYQAAGGHQ